MDNRERIISLAFKYEGEYFKIVKAIKNNEEAPLQKCDNCITIFDENYPKNFFELKYPPFVLFYKGDISLINKENKIGVVGSRIPCEYASKATIDLVNKNKDKIIVSGLAKGIDALAHKISDLSIGILGCGIDYVYPYENIDLYLKLCKTGLILSEYPKNTKPLGFHFPFRNRLIAALSDVVYVMQSSERSGTVTTINEALELQKDVKVLPFSIYENSGLYNNHLIQEGASLIEDYEIINT